MENANQHKSTPKDVFSYLLIIAMLYAGVTSFITLAFQFLEIVFPDALNNYICGYGCSGGFDAVRRSAAALIVVWPVYVFMSWLVGREIKNEHAKKEIKIRKWLVYLTLFISAVTIIIDLVTLIYNFLGGEVTVRFALKVLVVLIVAAAVFGYYLWDLKRQAGTGAKISKIFAWMVSVIIIASIVGAVLVVGTPAKQRLLRFDSQRVMDLQNLQSQIVNYWQLKDKLPAALGDLNDSISGFVSPIDPETGVPYEYNGKGPLAFELCATFNIQENNEKMGGSSVPKPVYEYGGPNGAYGSIDSWAHSAGRVCFARTIDPELYGKKSVPEAPKSPRY